MRCVLSLSLSRVRPGLLAKNEFTKHVSALRGLRGLVQSRPPDLLELCLEVVKILLHLEDSYSLEAEFTQLRHDSLVECATSCPLQVNKHAENMHVDTHTLDMHARMHAHANV